MDRGASRGNPRAGSEVTDVPFVRERELANFHLAETMTRVLRRAFATERRAFR
jgi:hypothetical protein